ncbi:MAG: penicillin-binding transpeptidase domain-containing protein, partial [Candidatus Amesbacteria bacterium]|nr:penicillin-binding transpeptidase domain-containing protein [Candidatus Amesbacteria bacterium]
PNYDGKYNVTLATRQPGSTIKPVVYLTGLRQGFTASTMLIDTKTSFPGGDKPEYVPENYDGKFRGPILVREALGNSINIPAVKMLSLVGIKNMMQMSYDLGIKSLEPTSDNLKRVGLSVALGGGEVRPLDIISAYSAFANGGIRRDPISILKVTDANNRVLEEWKPSEGLRVMSSGEAFIISNILSDPKARDITFGPRSLINVEGKTISVKTGTTNDRRDNWTIGWTPTVIVGVWVGNNDNTPMKEVASGVTGAAPIWRKVILSALKEKLDEPINPPSDIIQLDVDKISGYVAHDGLDSKKEYFIRGTESFDDDPIHKKIRDCNGDLKEALIFKEKDPFEKEGLNQWQIGIDEWLKGQTDAKYHPENIQSCGNQIWITMQSPPDKSRVDTNDVEIRFDVTSPSPIKKVEVSVDGVLKQTLVGEPWKVIANMPNASYHKIDVVVTDESGNVGSRFVEIGVNQDFSK